MSRIAFCFLVSAACVFLFCDIAEGANATVNKEITCFLIPHSHCDAGWKLTFEQYFEQKVHKILDNVLEVLDQDPTKKFIWSETSFLREWYQRLAKSDQQRFYNLIRESRLEIVNGGWVMMDEASSTLDSQINQLTEGHDFIFDEFHAYPSVAWQIDPFGHAKASAMVFKLAGYTSLVIDRIPLRIKDQRKTSKELQFIWRSSAIVGQESDILTHILDSWYWMPAGIRWEDGDPQVNEENIHRIASQLVFEISQRAAYFQTSDILFPFGSDFSFQDANIMFSNMDKLIAYINHKPEFGMQLKYATLGHYFDTVSKKLQAIPRFEQEYFPFEDFPWGGFWGGHYTSRPKLKQLVRIHDSMLRTVEFLAVYESVFQSFSQRHPGFNSSFLPDSRKTSALLNHHDAITGTSKALVVDDYTAKLENSVAILGEYFSMCLEFMHTNFEKEHQSLDFKPLHHHDVDFIQGCLEVSMLHSVGVTAVNSLFIDRIEFVSICLSFSADCLHENCQTRLLLENSRHEQVPYELQQDDDRFMLYFSVQVPALGYESLRLYISPKTTTIDKSHESMSEDIECGGDGLFSISNQITTLWFSRTDGKLKQVQYSDGSKHDMEVELFAYTSSKSGAYLFMPKGAAVPLQSGCPEQIRVLKSPLYEEVLVKLSSNITQSFKLTKYGADISLKSVHYYMRNHVPLHPNQEVVARIKTQIKNDKLLFTHNGVEDVAHHYDSSWTEYQTESNYKPLVTHGFINDTSNVLSVFAQRSHGIASLADGQIEVMLHRRLMQDDHMGLDEALDDTSLCSSRLDIIHASVLSLQERFQHSQRLMYPLQLASFTFPQQEHELRRNATLAKGASIPIGGHVQSFQKRREYIVTRLQNINPEKEILFNIQEVFGASLEITGVEKRSLTNLYKTTDDISYPNITVTPGLIVTLKMQVQARECKEVDYGCAAGFIKAGEICKPDPHADPYAPPKICTGTYSIVRYLVEPLALCRHGKVITQETIPCPIPKPSQGNNNTSPTVAIIMVFGSLCLAAVGYTFYKSRSKLSWQMHSVNSMPRVHPETVMLLRSSEWDEEFSDSDNA